MNIKYIFRVINILSCLVLQSQIYAMDDAPTQQNEIYYNHVHGNITLDAGLNDDSHNITKRYPVLQIDSQNLQFDENSNITIGEYNKLVLNNCNIIIDGNINCIGNIKLKLNNSQLILNNKQDNMSLLENYVTKIKLNNSFLAFNSGATNATMQLFSDTNAEPKIVLDNKSTVQFDNNITVNLNNEGKIDIDGSSFLGVNDSILQLGEGNLIVDNASKCNLINNAKLTSKRAQIKFNKGSILECTGNSTVDIKDGKVNVKDSTCQFTESNINLGSAQLDVTGNNSKFELLSNSTMNSNSKSIFRISSGNELIVDNSYIYGGGTIAQIGNDAIPMICLKNAQFIWQTAAYNPGIVLVEDEPEKPETIVAVSNLILDDLKD